MSKINLRKIMKNPMAIQKEMQKITKQLEETVIEEVSQEDIVTVKVTATKEVLEIKINEEKVKELVEEGEVELLEDLVLSTLNRAFDKADETTQELTGGLMGMF